MPWNSGNVPTLAKLVTRTLSAALALVVRLAAHNKAATSANARPRPPQNIEAMNFLPYRRLFCETPASIVRALPALRGWCEDLCADSYLGKNREPWFTFWVKPR